MSRLIDEELNGALTPMRRKKIGSGEDMTPADSSIQVLKVPDTERKGNDAELREEWP